MHKKIFAPFCWLSFFILFVSLNGCITYKPIQIKEIRSVEPVNNDFSSGKFILSLRVANPNNYPIKIKKYNLHAFLNNNDLGQVEVGEKIVLRKNSDEDYSLTFSPDVQKIMDVLPTLIFKGSGDVALKGSVKVKALFLSKSFDVDLKKRISAKDFR